MDEFETQPQFPENTQDTSATSRRNFLKVAVVSSAAAAAAVGGAGVAASALASRAPSGLSKLLVLNSNLISTKNACFTNTDFQDVASLNGNEGLYVWAWFTLGDAGSYSANLTAALPSFLALQGAQGQRAYLGLTGCPDSDPTANPTASSGATLPIVFTGTAGATVLIQLHLNATSAPAGTISLTVELTGPNGYDTTATTSVTFS